MSEQATSHKVEKILEQLPKKLTRQVVGSLVGCVHCGMCHDSCHYALAFPDDPKMTPSYKADQLRKIFKQHHDWTGRVFPKWVKASTPVTDDDLEELKDIAFGTCTNCRRCTYNCPMGVDTATLNRIMRGLLTRVGVMPEGVQVVSKDQWEIGNQMGVLKEDYLDTLEWMSEELEEQLGHDKAKIPVDKKGAKVMYTINPREAKYDPRTIKAAALIFYAAGEDWTMPSDGWDQTNFGLFSGDDQLGGVCGKRVYEKLDELGSQGAGHLRVRPRLPLDPLRGAELGRGRRGLHHGKLGHDHAPLREGRADQGRQEPQYRPRHLPRLLQQCPELRLLRGAPRAAGAGGQRLPGDVPQPHGELLLHRRAAGRCRCPSTPRGGSSPPRSRPTRSGPPGPRSWSPRVTTAWTGWGTSSSTTSSTVRSSSSWTSWPRPWSSTSWRSRKRLRCRRKLEAPVPAPVAVAEPKPEPVAALAGRRILVVDDEEDVRTFLSTVLEDAGAEVLLATDGDEGLAVMAKEKPDLVTLDLSMPGRDGVETFAEMRKHPEVKEIPVCVVTGHPEFRKVIYDRAVPPPEGYMDKPVDEEELVSNLKRILDLREKNA